MTGWPRRLAGRFDRAARRLSERSALAFAMVALVAYVGLLVIGHRFTFWQDEWGFIGRSGLSDPTTWFEPHNEHWTTLPLLAYRLTLRVVGLTSYLPFLAELLLVHVAVAAGVFVLVRRRIGPLGGLAAGTLVLLLGSGYQNLFWAFQLTFVGAVATGVWALVALGQPGTRPALIGAALLVASVACSAIGLVFVAAIGVELALSRGRRWFAVLPSAAVYAAWSITFGRTGAQDMPNPVTPEAVADVAYYVVVGTSRAVSGVTGTHPLLGGLIAALVLGVTAWTVARRRAVDPRMAGALTGLVVLYGTLGLTRGPLAGDFTDRSRYIYVAAVFILLFVSASSAAISVARRRSRVAGGFVAVAMVVALAGNLRSLVAGAEVFRAQSDLTRAYIALVREHRGATWIDPDIRPPGLPPPARLIALTDRRGSPTRDMLVPAAAPAPRPEERERALLMLVGDAYRVQAGAPPSGRATMPILLNLRGLAARPADCLSVRRTGGTAYAEASVPSDGWLEVVLPDGGGGRAFIGHDLPPAWRTSLAFLADLGGSASVHAPSIRDGSAWRIGIELDAPVAELCTWTAGPEAATRRDHRERWSSSALKASSRNGDGASGS